MNSIYSCKNYFAAVVFLAVLGLANGISNGETYGGGSGTPNEPYLIYDANQMNAIGANSNDWNKHFKLMADIDLSKYSGDEYNIIGNFSGVFDGAGHVINNFTYSSNNKEFAGLFARIEGDRAIVRNLALLNPNVTVKTWTWGGAYGSLVGTLKNGAISCCWSAGGNVTGDHSVGGLVGNNCGTVSDCYSTTGVTEYKDGWVPDYAGGLVGHNSGTIYNCYSTGRVSGREGILGGLVGRNDPIVGVVFNSFWDIQSSGRNTSAGGVGKTTAQMKNPNTFLNAGWDFVGEFENGPSDIWAEPIGGGYMILWWQLSPWPALPTFSGGTGALNDPYLISTTSDLNKIGYNPRLMNAHFKLIDDINLKGIQCFSIANSGNPFTGTFDGNSRKISNFSCVSIGLDCIGLFKCVSGSHAQIKDLGLNKTNIAGNAEDYVGALVGYLCEGTINGCWSDGGNIKGDDNVGGLVGCNYFGNIFNSHSTSNVTADTEAGGLVGRNWGVINNSYSSATIVGSLGVGGLAGGNPRGNIVNSHSSGDTIGDGWVGGLVGSNNRGTITNSFSEGSVRAKKYEYAGGLVGWNNIGTISTSCSLATVVGYTGVGGLVGYNARGEIYNSYSMGKVEGDDGVGGLTGSYHAGVITNCYSTGRVLGGSNVGGLAGVKFISGTVNGSFWDVTTSRIHTSVGGTGKKTAQMQTKTTFTSAGWDFTTPIWIIDEGNDYPRLRWEGNAAPVACIAGGDQIVEADSDCEGRVVLDGSCSSDEDSTEGTNDDINDFDWYEIIDPCDPNSDIYIGSGEVIECNLPLGEHDIMLEVIDKAGAFDTNEVTITVEDMTAPIISLNGSAIVILECGVDSYTEEGATATDNCDEDIEVVISGDTVDTSVCGTYLVTYDATDDSGNPAEQVTRTVIVQDTLPPEFSLWVEPNVLWPVDHKMVEIRPSWEVSDNCDEWLDVSLVSITMNEDAETKGSGHTIGDIWVDANDGIQLRAERSGKGTGRVYTIIYQAVDDSNNVTVDSAIVTVPHDMK